MFKYIAFSTLLALAYSQTPMHECDSGLPLPTNFVMKGCPEEPCLLPQKSVINMNVTFNAPRDLEAMHGSVVAYALGITTPYPLDEPNVCNSITNTACPVVEGEEVIWFAGMEILEAFPQIPLELEFTVSENDESGEGLFCFKFSAKVVAPEQL